MKKLVLTALMLVVVAALCSAPRNQAAGKPVDCTDAQVGAPCTIIGIGHCLPSSCSRHGNTLACTKDCRPSGHIQGTCQHHKEHGKLVCVIPVAKPQTDQCSQHLKGSCEHQRCECRNQKKLEHKTCESNYNKCWNYLMQTER